MNFFVILLLAVGLAMDSFAVAVASGISLKNVKPRQIFRLSFHFGLFHIMMPVIGWLAGRELSNMISRWDHWVAFGLLFFIGAKAIYSTTVKKDDDPLTFDPTKGFNLIMLSVATSLDALAVGLSFAILDVSIWYPVVVIGIVIALITTLGLMIGSSLGPKVSKRMEILGGLILIGIG
ncbi:manganese efflux pump MntP family protein, partial [bacterium]|nr:manganese efflux pump MntP family protein [bacterium]MBU1025149.1 manganese efflux pump MntP family protein [bacterium]